MTILKESQKIDIIGHNCSNLLESALLKKIAGLGDIDDVKVKKIRKIVNSYGEHDNIITFMGELGDIGFGNKWQDILNALKKIARAEKKYGSYAAFFLEKERAIAEVLKINNQYRKAGANIFAPHSFRAGPTAVREVADGEGGAEKIVRKTEENIAWCLQITDEILTRMKEDGFIEEETRSTVGMNIGPMFEVEMPKKESVEYFTEAWTSTINQAQQWIEEGKIFHVWMEAATTVNEVAAVANLCNERNIPFDCSFVGIGNDDYGVMIPDPETYDFRTQEGGIPLAEAIQQVDALCPGEGVRTYGLNCGTHRDHYEKAIETASTDGEYGETFKQRFSILYPNNAYQKPKEKGGNGVSQFGAEYLEYVEEPYPVRFKRILAKYPFIKRISVCCGSDPHVIHGCVCGLQHENGMNIKKVASHIVKERV